MQLTHAQGSEKFNSVSVEKHFDCSVQLDLTSSNRCQRNVMFFKGPFSASPNDFQKTSSVNFNRQNTFHYKSISKQLTTIENDSNSARSSLDVASRVAIGREIERNFCSFCVVCRFGNLAAHYLLFCSFVGRDCCSNWTWFMVFLFVCSCLHLL